jgi:hypothetical protein
MIRSVCHEWKRQAEYSFYLRFKQQQQTLSVKVNKQIVKLIPTDYDAENQVIEFHPEKDAIHITETKFNAHILFSEWTSNNEGVQYIMDLLEPHEQAVALFHLNYNPTREHLYELHDPVPDLKTRYTGDQGIVVAFEHTETGIRINYVHTNLSWLLSGINPNVAVQQIYASKYKRLLYDLDIKGFKPSRPHSEAFYRIMMEDTGKLELVFSRKESSVASQRLARIQNVLQEKGVDPRMVWKYTFIKNYIYRSMYSNMDLDQVVKAILDSENKWMKQKKGLVKKMKEKRWFLW